MAFFRSKKRATHKSNLIRQSRGAHLLDSSISQDSKRVATDLPVVNFCPGTLKALKGFENIFDSNFRGLHVCTFRYLAVVIQYGVRNNMGIVSQRRKHKSALQSTRIDYHPSGKNQRLGQHILTLTAAAINHISDLGLLILLKDSILNR